MLIYFCLTTYLNYFEQKITMTAPTQILQIINQLFDMEKKMEKIDGTRSLQRNLRRIKGQFEELGYQYHNPIGEPYDETRTDCQATITGYSTKRMIITEVIKPIITIKEEDFLHIVQQGVVIVEGR